MVKKAKKPTEPKRNGRPPFFTSPEELKEKVSEYFESGCNTKTIHVKINKDTRQQQEVKIPTVTWLALYLGFADRRSFYDYEKLPKFTHTIKRARTFIEQEYEELLRYNPTWAIFALKNFGWSDKQEHDIKLDANINLWEMTTDELYEFIHKWQL